MATSMAPRPPTVVLITRRKAERIAGPGLACSRSFTMITGSFRLTRKFCMALPIGPGVRPLVRRDRGRIR